MNEGQKIRCVNANNQKVLKLGEIYTVDTTISTTDNRVYIKEWERFHSVKIGLKL